ncbi:hypothetical protein CBM2606_A150169 [Cupriavidus taiwanensis]|nr:hypothetical protein CBM2606_A150169 [Cupriavidus taiwanensis]
MVRVPVCAASAPAHHNRIQSGRDTPRHRPARQGECAAGRRGAGAATSGLHRHSSSVRPNENNTSPARRPHGFPHRPRRLSA